jgi:hypothetical protein
VPQSLNSPLHSLTIPNNFKTRFMLWKEKKLALMQNDALCGRSHDTGTLKFWEKKEELDLYATV